MRYMYALRVIAWAMCGLLFFVLSPPLCAQEQGAAIHSPDEPQFREVEILTHGDRDLASIPIRVLAEDSPKRAGILRVAIESKAESLIWVSIRLLADGKPLVERTPRVLVCPMVVIEVPFDWDARRHWRLLGAVDACEIVDAQGEKGWNDGLIIRDGKRYVPTWRDVFIGEKVVRKRLPATQPSSRRASE